MYDLNRFIKAQEVYYNEALKEIRNGKKESHWIWFVFPQIRGLGYSEMANYYGIEDLEEAKAYLNNEYLKHNLLEIAGALLEVGSNNPTEVLGYPDDLNLKSSMTLFYSADPSIDLFKQVIDKFYNGKLDENTIKLLKKNPE